MTMPLKRLSLAEFGLRAVARHGKGDWLVLAAPESEIPTVASRIKDEVEALGDSPVQEIRDPANASSFIESVRGADQSKLLIVSGIEFFSEEHWRYIDLLRSRLMRPQAVIMVLSLRSIEYMVRSAPNLSGWIGGSIWEADIGSEVLSDKERHARLQSLREWSGLTDEEMVYRAERGKLPKEPEYVEWLVLLNRGDLVGN